VYSNHGSIRRSPRTLVAPSGSTDGGLQRIVLAHDFFEKVDKLTVPPGKAPGRGCGPIILQTKVLYLGMIALANQPSQSSPFK
jgi:hypothetical protein